MEEVKETKRVYGWPEDAQFLVPDGVREHFAEGVGKRGAEAHAAWMLRFEAFKGESPELAAADRGDAAARAPRGLGRGDPLLRGRRSQGDGDPQGLQPRSRTRSPSIPWLIAGSADLTDSTSVRLTFDGAVDLEPGSYAGRQLHFGIREHESAAISNGLVADQAAPALVDLPDLLRLCPSGDPPLLADGAAGRPRLHPRLDRPRRGRPDPPAGRADRLACAPSPAST